MIEKLKEHDIVDPKTDKIIGTIGCDLREIMDKLNEVIDAVNELKTKVEIVEECLHPTAKVDPYAEQRKALGIAVDALKELRPAEKKSCFLVPTVFTTQRIIDEALEQITALEQKDK